jgi:hypothetical protein
MVWSFLNLSACSGADTQRGSISLLGMKNKQVKHVQAVTDLPPAPKYL